MRRLARWLFTLLSGGSVALFAAVAVLWVRSYWAFDAKWVGWGRPSGAGTSSGYVVTGQNWPGQMWFAANAVTDADPPWWRRMHKADGTGPFVDFNAMRYPSRRRNHYPAFSAGRAEKRRGS